MELMRNYWGLFLIKVTFVKSTNKQEFPVLTIEDGVQFTVELSSKEAHLMAASFAHYLLKNIGTMFI